MGAKKQGPRNSGWAFRISFPRAPPLHAPRRACAAGQDFRQKRRLPPGIGSTWRTGGNRAWVQAIVDNRSFNATQTGLIVRKRWPKSIYPYLVLLERAHW